MVPQILALADQAVERLFPALKLIIVILATHPDPVSLELGGQALQLWHHLGLERIVPVQKGLGQLTHDVCVYMDGRHGKIPFLTNAQGIYRAPQHIRREQKICPGKILLSTHLECTDPLQMCAQTLSGLSALLAEPALAEAKKRTREHHRDRPGNE